MLKSIYTPLSGAIAQERLMGIIANNLANVNTPAFKGEKITFKLLEPEPEKRYLNPLPPANYKQDLSEVFPLHGNDVSYVGVSGVTRDMSQGPAIETKNPLDLMIEGEGFFKIQTAEGERYTRAGNFTLNADGVLSDYAGNPVLGEKGVIQIRTDNFEVNHLGEVYQDGQMVDRLSMTRFLNPDAHLEKTGSNLYFFHGPEDQIKTVDHPAIRQGFIEGSNVNAIKGITDMILAHRSYEAYQKAVSNYDQMMDKSSNSIGEIRA